MTSWRRLTAPTTSSSAVLRACLRATPTTRERRPRLSISARSRTALRERYAEEKARLGGSVTNWRSVINAPERMIIVDPPKDPDLRSTSRQYVALSAPLAGILLGIVLVILAEVFDKTIRYTDQMSFAGVPFLGSMPLLKEGEAAARLAFSAALRLPDRPMIWKPGNPRTNVNATNKFAARLRQPFWRAHCWRASPLWPFSGLPRCLASASPSCRAPRWTSHCRRQHSTQLTLQREAISRQRSSWPSQETRSCWKPARPSLVPSPCLLRQRVGWVTIRSGGPLPAEGARATSADSRGMATIMAPGRNAPALQWAPGSQNYRVIGLNITAAPSVTQMVSLVNVGDGKAAQNSEASEPRNIVIDRCYIHGSDKLDLKRGVALNSGSSAVINSTISEIHSTMFDSQAIAGWNGTGPYLIWNNTLEAAGENVMFGGADPSIPNLIPSDITIQNNRFFKPLNWQGKFLVKNLFELKLGDRVLVQNNTFENNWVSGQNGFAILMASVDQDGAAPWSRVTNVTFRQNVVVNSPNGINIASANSANATPAYNFDIDNNLLYNIGTDAGGTLFQVLGYHGSGLSNLSITNNTAILQTTTPTSGSAIMFDGLATTGFIFKNNIVSNAAYGISGSGYGTGNAAIAHYAPGGSVSGNVLIGGSSNAYTSYPGNFFPSTVSFVNPSTGNYDIAGTNPYGAAGRRAKAGRAN